MTHPSPLSAVAHDDLATPSPTDVQTTAALSAWMRPIEALAAALMLAIIVLLLGGVISRYVFSSPIAWIDEAVSIAFLWVAMLGAAIAMHRNEHLRLTLVVDRLAPRARGLVHAFGLVAVVAFLVGLIGPATEYVFEEWYITTPTLDMPNSFRVAAIPFGLALMLAIVLVYALRTVSRQDLVAAALFVAASVAALWWLTPALKSLGLLNLVLFLVIGVALFLAAGVPIAFCFGAGVMGYLAFASNAPLLVIVGRMDEGMANLVLVSVPIFVLLGCLLDATGMGKAIVDFLASLIGHLKAGMSYVLLGSLFIVSGISGSKVSDMATVAPALFPEMKRRGNKQPEMVALLATGAAMADTVPPSIVLIVLGSVAGVSIAGLFESGFFVAMVLLLALLVLARWKARHEATDVRRAPLSLAVRTLLVAAPALVLPFLIRGAAPQSEARRLSMTLRGSP